MTAPVTTRVDGPDARWCEHPVGAPRALFRSVLHVNEKGGRFGGTEEYIALLTAGLTAQGVRSHLVCGVLDGAPPPGLSSVHVVDGLASRAPLAGTAEELAAVIDGVDPDVVYLHNVFDPAVVAAIAGRRGGRTVIWYVHDHYVTCLSELRWRRDVGSCPHRLGHDCLTAIGEGHCVMRFPDRVLTATDLGDRMALSRSLDAVDAVVVVSDYMRSLLTEAAPHLRRRVHLVARPIRDLGLLRLRHRHAATDPAVIAYAGRITPEKGLAVVIEALGRTTNPAPIELRIAGVVEDQSYWQHCLAVQAVAMAANPRLTVDVLGHLDYDATDELFRSADIVTIPSQWPEPLGAVALEAMSAGSAVVAASIGGLGSTLRHGRSGLLVEPTDVTAWVGALTALLDDPALARRLGTQAHRDVGGAAIGDHVGVLDEIATTSRRRRPA
ncbi:MAG: glycosyltransferase family 4 protein [Ilumatobacteraceae bacterium]